LPEYLNIVFIGKKKNYSKAFLFEIKQQKEGGILSPVTAMVLKLIKIQLPFLGCDRSYSLKCF
jgi:hypothetical protein